MKKLIPLCFILFSFTVYAAKKTKQEIDNEKTYRVSTDSSQVKFESAIVEKEKSKDTWNFALSRSGITYNLPSLAPSTSDFSNQNVGLTLGKKQKDQLFNRTGEFEYSFEWQNYERSAQSVSNLKYTQKLNLIKLNMYQNFLVFNAFKNSLLVSFGIGASPLVTALEQSSLSNSSTDLGFLFSVKSNIDYPFKNKILSDLGYLALDLEMSLGFGEVANQQMIMTSIKLGTNFKW